MVKINNSSKHQVLTRFLQISGVSRAKKDVSTRYLLYLSPGVKIIKRNDMLTYLLSVSRGVHCFTNSETYVNPNRVL